MNDKNKQQFLFKKLENLAKLARSSLINYFSLYFNKYLLINKLAITKKPNLTFLYVKQK